MTHHNQIDELDEVLFAFHRACANPSADEIIAWTDRYPQFAADIRAHAAILKDWAARRNLPADEPDELMLTRARSRALDALYNAEVARRADASSSERSFAQMMQARGTDVPQLARDLNIARSVLADLVSGGMRGPVGRRLIDALTHALAITEDAFQAALQVALRAPRLGHAKAHETPSIIARSYEEIIRDSAMPPERQCYWLGKD
jgi:hypothetical protein